MTDVASSTRKKLGVVDSDMDGTTEAIPLQAFGEKGRVVLIGVAGELFHAGGMYELGTWTKVGQLVELFIRGVMGL